jgi:formylmethanofuran dehydrogenase subunit E
MDEEKWLNNMDDVKKLKWKVFKSAMEEYSKNEKIENTRCEKCNELIIIELLGNSAYSVKCKCGYHNDTLRGL